MSLPETSNSLMWNSGRVRVMMCAMKPSMMMRITTASPKPVMRARSRWAGLTLFAKIATKTRLSIPKTTLSTRSVAKLKFLGDVNLFRGHFHAVHAPGQKAENPAADENTVYVRPLFCF